MTAQSTPKNVEHASTQNDLRDIRTNIAIMRSNVRISKALLAATVLLNSIALIVVSFT